MNTQKWPSEFERKTGSSWVEKYPRPKEGDFHASILPGMQAQWDEGKVKHDRNATRVAEIRAQRAADEQEKREAAEKKATERREAQNAEVESTLKRRFVAAGGSEAEWEQEKIEVIAEHRRRQIAAAETSDDKARRQHFAATLRSF